MTEKPQVDFEEVVKASGMPVTEEEIRDRFNAIATEEGLSRIPPVCLRSGDWSRPL